MIKIFLSAFIIMGSFAITTQSYAALNVKNSYEFSKLCYKRNRNLKNYVDICACQKKNFRWLLNDKQWNDAKTIYTEKVTRKEMKSRDGLSAIDFLIVTIENKCSKNQTYFAHKAQELAKKKR